MRTLKLHFPDDALPILEKANLPYASAVTSDARLRARHAHGLSPRRRRDARQATSGVERDIDRVVSAG